MKKCFSCGIEKLLDQFYIDNTKKIGTKPYCKECCKLKEKNRKPRNRVVANLYVSSVRVKKRQVLIDYLLQHPCIICGESDPIVLDFDHINPETKFESVSTLAGKSGSIARLMDEINKCQILCANCHRRKTAKQRGWYKNNTLTKSNVM